MLNKILKINTITIQSIMKHNPEIINLKKEMRILKLKINELNKSIKQTQKLVIDKNSKSIKRGFNKKISFLDRFENEKRMRNLMFPD